MNSSDAIRLADTIDKRAVAATARADELTQAILGYVSTHERIT